jgi:hypothetical protein
MAGTFAVEAGHFGWDYIIYSENEGRTRLVQTDWDYPGLASNMGWVPCACGMTDGTVDCAHRTAGDMIASAQAWIDEHIGEVYPDPGYFGDGDEGGGG